MIDRVLWNSKGSATIVAILLVIFLVSLGTGITMLTRQSAKTSANYSDGLSAQYGAEAGVQVAVANLRKDTSKLDALTAKALAAGSHVTYEYTSTKSGNIYTVTSTGKALSTDDKEVLAQRTIKATIEVDTLPDSMFGDSTTMNNDCTVKSDPPSAVSVETKENATITKNDNATIAPNISLNPTKTCKLPDYPSEYITWTESTSKIGSDNLKPSGTYTGTEDTYYCSGDLVIQGTLTVTKPTTIYVNNGIKFDKDCIINGPITFVTKGGINADKSVKFNDGQPSVTIGLYALGDITVDGTLGGKIKAHSKNGQLKLNSSASQNAELIAPTLIINNDVKVTGNVYTDNFTMNGGSTLTIVPKGGATGSKGVKITSWANYHG